MAWVAVNLDGNEVIFDEKPVRIYKTHWTDEGLYASGDVDYLDSAIHVPKGTIEKIIGRELTWKDECVEL